MKPFVSAPSLLTLHAIRLKGMADETKVARRFALDLDEVTEHLLDFEAHGWAQRVEFAGERGWTLTESGRREDERQLADELAESGASGVVADAHAAFLPLNARFQATCTDWQLRPLIGAPMAANDHTDFRWDARVLDSLGSLGRRMAPLVDEVAGELARFSGYADRYADALAHVQRGERAWVDGVGLDSCHGVWFEIHEDLLATLGRQRGQE